EAEADGEDRPHAGLAQMLHRRARVRLYTLARRLLDVRPVLEVVAALLRAGRAAEVVDRERRMAALGESECELLVEAVEAADVRKDHDPGGPGRLGRREEGREAVAVGGGERQVLVRDGGARDPRDRRLGIGVEAHGRESRASCLCRFNTSRSAVSSSLEHAADVVRDLEVLPRTDDERPHRRARSADLRVRLAGAVARGVEGDTEEAEAVRGTPSDLRGVLP